AAHLALLYDPRVLSVSAKDISLGSIPGLSPDWQLSAEVDALTGQIGITLFSANMTPITSTKGGSLINITFHVAAGARLQEFALPLTLVSMATPNGKRIVTDVDDNQGPLILNLGSDWLAFPVAPVLRHRSK